MRRRAIDAFDQQFAKVHRSMHTRFDCKILIKGQVFDLPFPYFSALLISNWPNTVGPLLYIVPSCSRPSIRVSRGISTRISKWRQSLGTPESGVNLFDSCLVHCIAGSPLILYTRFHLAAVIPVWCFAGGSDVTLHASILVTTASSLHASFLSKT